MIYYSNSLTFWLPYISMAQQMLGYKISDELQYYLVMMLGASVKNLELSGNDQIINYLTQNTRTQEIAEQCLVLSGMFPGRSLYIGAGSFAPLVWVGQQAYAELAKRNNFYNILACDFVDVLDLILCIRFQLTQKQLSNDKLMKLLSIGSNYPKLPLI